MSHQQIILSEIAFIQFPRDFNTSSYKDGTKRWQTTWNILKTLEVPCDKEFCLHPSRLTARVGFYDREFAFLPIYLKQNLARSSTQDDREMRMGFKLRFNECHRSLVWCFAWVCFSSFKCFSAPSHVRINRCKNKFSSELLFWQWHRIIIGRTHVDDSVLDGAPTFRSRRCKCGRKPIIFHFYFSNCAKVKRWRIKIASLVLHSHRFCTNFHPPPPPISACKNLWLGNQKF